MYFTSNKVSAADRQQISGDDLKKLITLDVKPSEVGFKPNKIYGLKDGKVILEAN